MELYQLGSFAAVAESGHLTRAADRLHLSQPALSAQIKALEDELGVALFERLSSGMELTPAGRRLLPEAHKVVAAAQVLRSHASAFKGEVAGRVSVGTVSDPNFIRVVAPVSWRERVENAPWDEIVAMPWVMTPPISTHSTLAGVLFHEHAVSPARRVEADHEAVIKSLVVAGLGVSLMREDLAIEAVAAGEVVLWGDKRLETTLSFVYLAEREDEPVVRALREVLDRVWTQSLATEAA